MNYLTWQMIFFKALRQGIVVESPKRVGLVCRPDLERIARPRWACVMAL
jgi:hypothetical protein